MSTVLYTKVKEILDRERTNYEESLHQAVFTSGTASLLSGHADEEGTKSLVIELGSGALAVVTVTGADRIDFGAIKKLLGEKKAKMCSPDLLSQRLGTELGGVAPFGYDAEVKLLVSPKLFVQQAVYFNAGRNDVTVKVTGPDFQKIMASCGAHTLD
jgi:prolyl-tRNA editing enzyme YbaK/EbsC (Cys-tRNA(Pro) deacylase)